MSNILSDILIDYLINRTDETILLGFPDSRHFEMEKDLTLKDLLESYKAIKEELRKLKQEGNLWITDDKEEDGWLCMNPFCNHADASNIPEFCPKCGARKPIKVRGCLTHKTQTYWQPTRESIKIAMKEELEKEEASP